MKKNYKNLAFYVVIPPDRTKWGIVNWEGKMILPHFRQRNAFFQ